MDEPKQSFTMEMLIDAVGVGHELAQIMGPAPMTPGTPVTPDVLIPRITAVLKYSKPVLQYPNLLSTYLWSSTGTAFDEGSQYFYEG